MKNIKQLFDNVSTHRDNFIVAKANDHCLRLAVNNDLYPWHCHPNSDELFIVLEGELTIEYIKMKSVTLKKYDVLLVPAGLVHRTRPNGRTVNLCIERIDAVTRFVPNPQRSL